MADYGIRLEREDQIAVVTFDRPGRQNTFDEHMWDCMEKVVADLKARLPRVVVLTGSGERAFSAGFDVNPENPMVTRLIEAVQKHTKLLAELNWERYVESISYLGTSY